MAEENWWPASPSGRRIPSAPAFSRNSLRAATKNPGGRAGHSGYGRKLIDGVFGGLRYSPSWLGSWSFVSEYDASDYKNFPFAEESHVSGRRRGFSNAIEYRLGWMSAAISNQRGVAGAAAYLSIRSSRRNGYRNSRNPSRTRK